MAAVQSMAPDELSVIDPRCASCGRLDIGTLDVLPDAVVTVGPAGQVTGANRAARLLLGEPVGAPRAIAALVAPGSRDLWDELWARIGRGDTVPPTDLDFLRGDGQTIPVEISMAPAAGGGGVAILRDAAARRAQDEMTQRMLSDMEEHQQRVEAQAAEIIDQAEALQVSERRLHLILESTQDAYWDWDVAAGTVDFSARFAEVLGLSSGTAESVDDFVVRVHPDDREAVRAGFARVESKRTAAVHLGEFRLHYADGRVHWVTARGQVVTRDETGRARRALGMLSDVSERKARDEERQRHQRLEAVGGLAAGVAHEINTPLQLVGDNLTFLAEHLPQVAALFDAFEGLRAASGLPTEWRAVLDRLLADPADDDLDFVKREFPLAVRESQDGIDRVSRIVRALKEFAHPGQAERERVDLRRVLDNAITLARSQWKNVAPPITDYGDLPEAIVCSQGECTQLFLNLLVNAAQAVSSGGRGAGTIRVRGRATEGGCLVEVEDNGPGIAAAIRERVFDPFFTTKPAGQGTGQGLSLARAIVRRHGGTISFESEPGRCTTFTVFLPLTAPPVGTAAA